MVPIQELVRPNIQAIIFNEVTGFYPGFFMTFLSMQFNPLEEEKIKFKQARYSSERKDNECLPGSVMKAALLAVRAHFETRQQYSQGLH